MIQDEKIATLNNLINDLFSWKKDTLSQDEFELIRQNKNIFTEKFLSIVENKLEILCSDQQQDFEDRDEPGDFYWSIIFLAMLEERSAFHLIIKLCSFSEEDIEDYLGEDFIIEELPFCLALTGQGRWKELMPIIQDDNQDLYIRSACLDAMVIMVTLGHIPRSEVVEYFQSLLRDCANNENCTEDWSTEVVSACADIWPGECLDDIRELYGLLLVNTRCIDMNDVLEDLEKGEEACIDDIKNRFVAFKALFISDLRKASSFKDLEQKDFEEVLKDLITQDKKIKQAVDIFLSHSPVLKLGRNELCLCSSGKKFKKCCLGKKDNDTDFVVEECTISSDPVMSKEMSLLSPLELEKMSDLYEMLEENPDAVLINKIQNFIALYPNLPMLCNYLFLALVKTEQYRKGMEVLKQTVQKFPDYLFALVEYGKYWLRRGEPERIPEIFNNCWTLNQMYPDRNVFHWSEVKVFSFVMALYCVEVCNIKQAKIYMSFLAQVDDDAVEVVKERMYRKMCSMKYSQLPLELVALIERQPKSMRKDINAEA